MVPAIPLDAEVIIPTYNNSDALAACLRSLDAQPERIRLLVCVDGSTDGTLEYLASARNRHELVVLQHADRSNHGRAVTRNLALSYLTAPVVLLLDSDMELEVGALGRHLGVLASRSCVSVGDVVYRNASTNLWARYLETRGKNKFAAGSDIPPMNLGGANVALRSAALLSAGGFDESLSGYGGEDTELGMRLGALGWPIVFNAAARAFTDSTKSVAEGLRQLEEFGRINLPRIRAAHPDLPGPFWSDRFDSPRLVDRAVRLGMNSVSDAIVSALLPRVPFVVQSRLLNYAVIRAVHRGYAEAPR